jgi:hypothetical protein
MLFANSRAATSVPPPGAKPTTILALRDLVCANEGAEIPSDIVVAVEDTRN